jgi:hypothetical protein
MAANRARIELEHTWLSSASDGVGGAFVPDVKIVRSHGRGSLRRHPCSEQQSAL